MAIIKCKERLTKTALCVVIYRCACLLDIEYQSLKVFALRMIDAHGVVSGLGELVQDTHATTRHGSGGEDSRAEVVLRHHL